MTRLGTPFRTLTIWYNYKMLDTQFLDRHIHEVVQKTYKYVLDDTVASYDFFFWEMIMTLVKMMIQLLLRWYILIISTSVGGWYQSTFLRGSNKVLHRPIWSWKRWSKSWMVEWWLLIRKRSLFGMLTIPLCLDHHTTKICLIGWKITYLQKQRSFSTTTRIEKCLWVLLVKNW